MIQPNLLLITLSNGDVAIFNNDILLYSLEAAENGFPPIDLADKLAESLSVTVKQISMDVPSDNDWNWSDVYELLPCDDQSPCSVSRYGLSHWESYDQEQRENTHQLIVENALDQRGQYFMAIGEVESEDPLLINGIELTCEINEIPLEGGYHSPCVHVHFNESELAISLFKVGEKILMRPETGVQISRMREQMHGRPEEVFWIESSL